MNHQAGGPVQAATPSSSDMSAEALTKKLNTAIYDYLLRNSHYEVARAMHKATEINTKPDIKHSPGQQNGQPNGIDDLLNHPALRDRPDDLPMPANVYDGPFLEDWWSMYWEIHFARRNKGTQQQSNQYVAQQRAIQKGRNGMMNSMDPAMSMRGYNGAVQGMPNGMAGMPNDLKRTAMQNRGQM